MESNPDYAIELLSQCVIGDSGNIPFLHSFLATLKKKHGPPKAKGSLAALWGTSHGGMKKAAAAKNWRDVVKQGVHIIRSSPYDAVCLLAMANACKNLEQNEAQRSYLRAALEAAPADVEVNKQCAAFLKSCGEFDQAIACWLRISNVPKFSDEAQKAMSELHVEKTIVAGNGLVGRESATKKSSDNIDESSSTVPRITLLRQAIEKNPADVESYLELADLVEKDESIEEAQKVLNRALSASGGDMKVVEHIEDRQLRWAKHGMHIAEKRFESERTEANKETLEKLKTGILKQEIDVFSARTSRYPENTSWRYELAMRLKAIGNYPEAIKEFQKSLQDVRRKGVVSLELGECFQKIKQHQLAMRNYSTAVDSLTDRETDLRKRALYRAGVLAAGLEDLESAKKYLSVLAELDYGYRDVAQRLDKLDSVPDKSAE